MRYNRTAFPLLMLVVVGSSFVGGQSERVSITRRDEATQRRFVKEYLAAGAPVGRPFSMGEAYPVSDPGTGFGLLVKLKLWAEDATISEVQRLDGLTPRPAQILNRLAHSLANSASDRAFETILKRYRDDPHFELLIKLCIYGNLDTRHSQPYGVIYRALESDEAIIRDPARVHVKALFEYSDRTPYVEEFWAKALLRRYGHEPTDLEILKDPIAEEIRLANPGLSLSTIPRVRALAKRAATKR